MQFTFISVVASWWSFGAVATDSAGETMQGGFELEVVAELFDDACLVGATQCEFSLRQLRGEKKSIYQMQTEETQNDSRVGVPSCQGNYCSDSSTCCSGTTCQKNTGGGWDQACLAPQCVPEGGECGGDGQACCDGSACYHANGGSACTATPKSCVPEGGMCGSGEKCCDGSACYHANGGSACTSVSTHAMGVSTKPTGAPCSGSSHSKFDGGSFSQSDCLSLYKERGWNQACYYKETCVWSNDMCTVDTGNGGACIFN
eukprot:TRINITY_DN2805_c0_g1_i2.p1 TRINITY_DN2805_c0_g1~~TRINITY_DN2805_c0_g1_i2.p1  ORF type:complete len:259 (+),score=36.64 TRINITY_DN2805_c0_g1_i2:79-855(+)